ncbi:membrane protein [Thermococcus eurythermalis]|uniref:Membrane protein n=1 Tax=Thermococcus eurythermalis TaxID=1505907 RepID=A0A097QUQ7_9EURY|nr:DUF835 domain-containing protein [Thermococcus eurythermalis]AIU70215.1 membrane protein [Thermococcus eurythermalis]
MSIPGSNLIPYLNFISRWVLFIAVTYKAYKTKENGWVFLSAALFIGALDIENYILSTFGITIPPQVYDIASIIPNFAVGVLAILAALHLKYGQITFKHTVYMSFLPVIVYVWIFLVATNVLKTPTQRLLLPSLVFGGSLVYLALVLYHHVIYKSVVEMMFSAGLLLLGVLNITYPVTRFVDWFAPIGFFLGAISRFMAAVGAVKFVFYSVVPPSMDGEPPAEKGVFFFSSREEAFKVLGDLWSRPGTVVITREDLRTLKSSLNPEALVFWITRAKEGKLEERPQIYAMAPTKIDILTDLIAQALAQGYKTVYIEAFEYLMLENGFEKAVKFLLNIKDRVLAEGGTMVLVLNPETLNEKQRKIIEREFREFS